jgi:hypothetical protein
MCRFKQLCLFNHLKVDTCSYGFFSHHHLYYHLQKILTLPPESPCRNNERTIWYSSLLSEVTSSGLNNFTTHTTLRNYRGPVSKVAIISYVSSLLRIVTDVHVMLLLASPKNVVYMQPCSWILTDNSAGLRYTIRINPLTSRADCIMLSAWRLIMQFGALNSTR